MSTWGETNIGKWLPQSFGHTFGQTSTRNDWTSGISKSQHTHARVHYRNNFFMTFHLFYIYSLRNETVLSDKWTNSHKYYTTVFMSTSLALSTSITCKKAICGAACKLRDVFHLFNVVLNLFRDHCLHSMLGQSCWLFKHNILLEVD